MRLAVVGKGGSGKSLIAGTLARVYAQRGGRVLALDVDTMPGMVYSLGLDPDAVRDAILPEELGVRDEQRGWILREGEDVHVLVEKYAATAPDGIRFLQLGKLPHRVKPGSTTAFRAVLEEFRGDGWTLIADLAAGTRQPFFGWSDFAEIVLIVVDPSAKSILTARRLAKLANERPADDSENSKPIKPQLIGFVANKIRDERDMESIQRALHEFAIPFLAVIPFDEIAARAEQRGTAPFDLVPDSDAMMAIRDLASQLKNMNGAVK